MTAQAARVGLGVAGEQLGIAVLRAGTRQRYEIFRDRPCSGRSVSRGRAGGARGTQAGMDLHPWEHPRVACGW